MMGKVGRLRLLSKRKKDGAPVMSHRKSLTLLCALALLLSSG